MIFTAEDAEIAELLNIIISACSAISAVKFLKSCSFLNAQFPILNIFRRESDSLKRIPSSGIDLALVEADRSASLWIN